MIKFNNVFVKYVDEFYSLYDCSFCVSSHTILYEKNLCGANAVFRVLAKINNHYLGEVFIDNLNVKDIKDKDLNISYLPEKPVLFKYKSIEYNLSFPLKIRKINKKIIKNQINSLFFEYNLNNYKKNIKKLNLTEQKIIALLRVLIRQPNYILLENFFENFDIQYIETALKIIKKIKEKSIIIAYETNTKNLSYYENFNRVEV